jgi:hypothetical protein
LNLEAGFGFDLVGVVVRGVFFDFEDKVAVGVDDDVLMFINKTIII